MIQTKERTTLTFKEREDLGHLKFHLDLWVIQEPDGKIILEIETKNKTQIHIDSNEATQ